MSDSLAAGYVVIGGGGLTYTYTDFELTAEVGYITIDAPDLGSGLSGQTMFPAVGYVAIGGGSANLSFDDWSAELVAGHITIGAGATQLREIARVLFPALSPSSRNFTPPEYSVSKYKTMNGAKSHRLWASQPGGGVLDLEFVNLDDADAERICAAHDLAKGSTNDLILPDEVLLGAEGDLLQYMKRAVPSRTMPAVSWSGYAYGVVLSNVIPGIPDSLPDEVFWYNPSTLFYEGREISSPQAWAFDGPPEVQSVKEGISTVRVRLSARRKVQFNSVGSVGSTFAVSAAPVDEIDPGGYGDCDLIGVGESLSFIVYSQSQPGRPEIPLAINASATNAGMTNGVFAESDETGFEVFDEFGTLPQWVQMDLTEVRAITSVVIGCDFDNTLTRGEGAWGKGGTENLDVMYSADGTTWTFAFNTGTFTQGIQTYSVDFSARFIRLMSKLVDFSGFTFQILAVTEFYAT